MECLIFSDALRKDKKVFSSSSGGATTLGARSPTGMNSPNLRGGRDDVEEVPNEDSDSDIEMYSDMAPSGAVQLLRPQTASEDVSPIVDETPKKISETASLGSPSSKEPPQKPGPVRVLKKPFFKNWDDFMDFDCTFKVKMPITLSEMDLVLQKEAESNKGWDVCVDRKEIMVSKVMSGPGRITLRAWATIPGVHLGAAFFLFWDFRERQKWDKAFSDMRLIGDTKPDECQILYSMLELRIPGVTNRDFLQWRRYTVLEDGSICICLRSAEHPACPEVKSLIRAESYIGGYVLRQTFENGEPVLKLFLMSSSDVKGLIPKWIINWVAPKKPAEWVDCLRKASIDWQAENPDFQQKFADYMKSQPTEKVYDYEWVEAEADGVPVDANTRGVLAGETELRAI